MTAHEPYQHPENDLHSDADYANRYNPEEESLEGLAEARDPVVVAAANARSTKQAIYFTIAVPVLTAVVALILAVIARAMGGPLCDSGAATWICTRSARIWWPLSTCIIPLVGLFGCAFITYRKYSQYLRWRPWMGALWIVLPFALLWMTTVLQMPLIDP